ncbi:MAG: hypothetical protein AAF253_05910 [Pseudomonadota bacterium]
MVFRSGQSYVLFEDTVLDDVIDAVTLPDTADAGAASTGLERADDLSLDTIDDGFIA